MTSDTSPAGSHILSIDLGTGSVKALVVDERGSVRGRAAVDYQVDHPHPSWAEQDPERWWDASKQAVCTALERAGHPAVAGVGLSGQMHGTVLVDHQGVPVRPAIIWADGRSQSEVDEIHDIIGKDRVIAITGSSVFPGFQAASLRWVFHHDPGAWEATRHALLPKDYLRMRLTGEIVTEPSDASSTTLFDIRHRKWSTEMMDALHLDSARFPPVIESHEWSGSVRPHVAEAFGLPKAAPVVAGGGDAPLALLASGAMSSRSLLVTISTGSQIILACSSPRPDPQGRLHCWCNVLPADSGVGWYGMGATMTSGFNLRWLRDEMFELSSQTGYDQLTAWASEIDAGSDGLLFLPYLLGERTPHMDASARGSWIGIGAQHDRRHFVRSVMEGSTFAIFEAFETVKGHIGTAERIVLAGGGARSRFWQQMVADVFGMPLVPALEPDGSAFGAAMVAAGSAGWFAPGQAPSSWFSFGEPVEPIAVNHARYQHLFPVFKAAYHHNRETMHSLSQPAGSRHIIND